MATSLIDADSLLVVDVGSVSTRALLFDVVDGRYRFLGSGSATTTAGAPYKDVGEGVRLALDHLQQVSGRALVDANERLIMPSRGDGAGVDTFAATLSAGPPLKVLAVGLLDDVSLESARRLAATTYSGVLETISLNDRRSTEARLDALLRLHPDLIVVAGGTEGGASHSVLRLLEAVGLGCYLTPEEMRPEVLFAGNSSLQEEVHSTINAVSHLHIAPNIRPNLETELLGPAGIELEGILRRIRARQIMGVNELVEWAGGNLTPTASAFGRMIAFLSKAHNSNKGVLGVDVGAGASVLAAGFAGQLALGVYPQLGMGSSLVSALDSLPVDEVVRWLSPELPAGAVREYLANKAIRPTTLPAGVEELAIESALARVVMNRMVKLLAPSFPQRAAGSAAGLLPWFEPVLAAGSVISRAPTLGQSLLMLLDGLQPTGVTTFVLDQHHLTSALGAAAQVNNVLAVQVLNSSAYVHLGTVISPVGHARPSTPVLHIKITYENGQETGLDVKSGSLEVLPLPPGQSARLYLQPLHRYEVGMGGPGRGGALKVMGGALGVVIDARGRPLQLPDDAARRSEMMKKWAWTLGG